MGILPNSQTLSNISDSNPKMEHKLKNLKDKLNDIFHMQYLHVTSNENHPNYNFFIISVVADYLYIYIFIYIYIYIYIYI